MNTEAVYILQDQAHLWGLMALHTLTACGAVCRLVSANEIAQGALLRKPPRILLVPGGSARQKAQALGEAGMTALRNWVAQGGIYFGICGGAGLALKQGLGICSWQRASFQNRQAHLLSGHVIADCSGCKLPLPVWWPGRFEQQPDGPEVIAAYDSPGPDLWLADLPAGRNWQFAQELAAIFPKGQPLAVQGKFGKGEFILSYSHPETPDSEPANAWLCEILHRHDIMAQPVIAPWRTLDRLADATKGHELACACEGMTRIAQTGLAESIFFPRASWLLGWQQGAPGIACNNLIACLAWLAGHDLAPLPIWSENRSSFNCLFRQFQTKAESFLKRFAQADRQRRNSPGLVAERDHIFGHPMLGGGMADQLLASLERLIIACQGKNQGVQACKPDSLRA